MKNKFIYIVISIIFALLITMLWFCRSGLISTNNTSVFLGVNFGMSVAEVQRVLKKNDVELIDAVTFENLRSTPKRCFFAGKYKVPLFHDSDFKRTLWYMPSVEMYNSRVVAEFEFIENKLISIEINIVPISNKNVVSIIETITDSLKSKYESSDKNFDQWMKIIKNRYKTIKFGHDKANRPIDLFAVYPDLNKKNPLTYNRKFKNNVSRLNLWLNLSEQYDPIISINIAPTQKNTHNIKQREKNAFT